MVFNELNHFDDKEHETLMGIWWSGVLLKQRSRRFFRQYPVSDSQFNALMLLKYADRPFTQQDLSERMLVDKSNITILIDELEKLGFVRRSKIPGDRRFYHLEITGDGVAFFDSVEQEYRALIHDAMSIFTPEELAEITRYMVRLQAGLEEKS